MKTQIVLAKSFTTDKSAGNPTGIVLDASTLTAKQMQHIAATLGFAESVFVLPSTEADFQLRFFAPKHEVDLCGHGTVAALHTLIEQGMVKPADNQPLELTQITRAGRLAVTCHPDGRIVMAQNHPQFGAIEPDRARITKLLNLTEDSLLDLPLQVVSTGTPKLLIPLRSLAAVRAVQADLEGIKAYCRATTARGFYPFTLESPISGTDFFARQFNPLADENEDPVTGVAAGALGAYAQKHKLYHKQQFVVAQGYDLGQGGNMFVDVSDGVKVGGYAVTYDHQTLELP